MISAAVTTSTTTTTTTTTTSTPRFNKEPDIYTRINRVAERFALSFVFSLSFENKAQGGRVGLNLFKIVTIYPELVLHLAPRKEQLEGSYATNAEKLSYQTDRMGNKAFVATLAAAVASYALKFFAANAASQALLGVAGVCFAATILLKSTAFVSTLAADFCNQKPTDIL